MLDYFLQCLDASIVHVRCRKFDISQRWDLELPHVARVRGKLEDAPKIDELLSVPGGTLFSLRGRHKDSCRRILPELSWKFTQSEPQALDYYLAENRVTLLISGRRDICSERNEP